jgi:probable FeS assembly SUF system protein SufT
MSSDEPVNLTRDVEAAIIPVGDRVTLQKGQQAYITQSLGGSYTVIVNGNMFRIEGKDADALGLEVAAKPAGTGAPVSQEQLEKEIWNQLRSCYDPEIPVNIVDLGLIYDCHLTPLAAGSFRVDVKMTLTAPGCGMGPMLAQDVQNKVLSLEGVDDVAVELVWDPPWNQGMMTEQAKLQLGLL